MHVFINALSARLGGGQTYLLNLLKHVPQADGWRVTVLTQPSFHLAELPENVVRIEQAGLSNPLLRAVWEACCLPGLLKRSDVDLFFSPGGLLPRSLPGSVLTAVTFQNMLPFDHLQREKYPYGYRRLRDWLLERGLSSSMRRSELVVFISEFAREFIVRRLGDLRGHTIVAPHGIAPRFRAAPDTPARPRWLPDEGDYFLYVSFIDHYKAQLEVIRGYHRYVQEGGMEKLVLAGAEYPPYGDLIRREIELLGLTDNVMLVGNVPHEELPAAYQNAKINLFASFTENCPNILLEMMASGRPSLVSNRPPMPEFGGDAVAYFNPESPEAFACKLLRLAADDATRNRLGEAAMKRVENYSWESAAKLTWGAIAEVCRKDHV